MLKNIYKILLLISLLVLTGCATSPSVPVYNTSSNHYVQAMDLPADYPTKYLPDGNMWNEFKGNLRLPVDTSNPNVKKQIRWFQNHQSFLNNSIQRGAPFLYYAYQQTKKLNLPAELALIPIGESGFIPSNRSNRGAVGLWQFMPSTAAEFNLKVNKYYDGRRDPIASTNAALKYFTYLHYYFDNDWLLAIAAYDTGPGNIQKAQFRNQRQNLPTKDFWALNLHHETEEYIPKLLAMAAIIKNPKKYGVYLTPVNDSLYFDQVNIGHQINLNTVAKQSDSKLSIIKYLNPALLQGVTPPAGPHVVLIPKSKSSAFKKQSNSFSLFGSKEEPVITPTATPPATAPETTKEAAPIAESFATSAITNSSAAEITAKTEEADNTPQKPKYIKYTVKKKETLRKIAGKFGTSESKLRKINELRSNSIKTGQVLMVPNPDRDESNANGNDSQINTVPETDPEITPETISGSSVKPITDTNEEQPKQNPKIATQKAKSNTGIKTFNYKVSASDTIFSIAQRFNSSAESIQQLNHLKNNKIKPGQTLKIQGNSATVTESRSSAKKTSPQHKVKNTASKTTKKSGSKHNN